jgi:molybdopterin synthase catalytic subunit
MDKRVRIQTEDFDLSTELAALRGQDRRVGAVCSFVGTVRDRHADLERSTRRWRRARCSRWSWSTTPA